MLTIGVSIAVPDPWGTRLQDYRVALGDISARQIPSHITLAPPLEVADTDRATVEEHLGEVAAQTPPFDVHLRGTGTFRPVSPVVFVGVVDGISQCEQLTSRVRTGPLAGAVAFPYHPHVTIAHDVEDALLDRAFSEQADFDCAFEVDEFHLYLHTEDQGWQPASAYTLTGR